MYFTFNCKIIHTNLLGTAHNLYRLVLYLKRPHLLKTMVNKQINK